MIAAALLAPAAMADDVVNVEYGGNSERMTVGDVKSTSVCTLKQQVAAKFGLKMTKFDLRRKGGTMLQESKTLYGSGVRNHTKLTVKEVSYSSQC